MRNYKTTTLAAAILALAAQQTASAQTKAVSFHSSNGIYWQLKTEQVEDASVGKAQVIIRTGQPNQTFKGWGTTFNELDYDAWYLLSDADRDLFYKRVFNPLGDLRLTVGRIPVGASDYACDWYSCDETKDNATDFNMEHFTIERDKQKIIPSIKLALQENSNMMFWASPWSPPQWMKTNKHYAQRQSSTNGCPQDVPPYDNDQFVVDAQYYNAYCLYFDKFIQAYANEGINISALAYQNEAYSNTQYPGCSWKAETTGKFLAEYLGPYMAEHQPDLTLIIGTMNTNRYDVYSTILNTPNIGNYCKQIGFQWEGGQQIGAVRQTYPDYELVMTESECGSGTFDWSAAAHTFQLCNHYLANGVTTYTYWNTILKDKGLSTWGWQQNALIQVNSSDNTARYCPEYYAYKHYTHFIPSGSRILTCDEDNLVTSAQAPDGSVVVVIGNDKTTEKQMAVDVDGKTVVCTIAPKSFATYVIAEESVLACLLADEAKGIATIEKDALTEPQIQSLNSAAEGSDINTLVNAISEVQNNGEITNPGFTDGVTGWTVANEAVSGDFWAGTVLGKTCYNNWSNNFTSLDIHQDIHGLLPGLYKVSAYSVCGEDIITDQHVYAETATHKVSSPVKADDTWNSANWEKQTTETIYVGDDGILRIGYASTSGGGTKGWFCVTDFSLERIGDLTSDFDLNANLKSTGFEEAKAEYQALADKAAEIAAATIFDEASRSQLQSLLDSHNATLDELTDALLVGNLQRELEEALESFINDNLPEYIAYTGDATFLIQSSTITAETTTGWLRDNNSAAGYSEHPSAIQSDVHDGYGISHWRSSAIADSKLIYQTIESLPQGCYRLEGYAAATVWNNNNGNENRSGVFLFAGDNKTEVTTANYGKYSVDFCLDSAQPVTIGLCAEGNQGNTWCFLSDVRLFFTGVQATIKEGFDGYTSFCSVCPLDFGNRTDNLKAFIITDTDGTEQQVTIVPARKGVMLKGDAGTFDIPVAEAETTDDFSSSLLVGTKEATDLKSDSEYTYYVLVKHNGQVGFYIVGTEDGDTYTVSANKAYMKVPTSQAAKTFIPLGGNITDGIGGAVIDKAVESDTYYSLDGKKVEYPANGVFIINGKKVTIGK